MTFPRKFPRKFAVAPRINVPRPLVVFGLLVVLLFLPGCPTPPPIVPEEKLPPKIAAAPMPSYEQLIERYNARLVGVDVLSCRTQVEAVWRDDKGKRRRESGKGKLIFRRPLDTALTVEAFGKTVMWAGSNESHFWLFADLHEDGVVYYGTFAARDTARALPLAVSPDAVPFLLGLMPLSSNPPGGVPPVEALRGYALIEPPGMPLRMLLEPATGTPRRVDLLDAQGRSALICLLEGGVEVEGIVRPELHITGGELIGTGPLSRTNTEPGPPLRMPAVATIIPVDDESKMVIEFRNADAQDHRIRDELFDLGVLRRALKTAQAIDLDQPRRGD